MPQAAGQLSENSRRIARNTLLLYFRMFLLMLIGLFTSRVVLRVLGIDDYGTYNVVGGVVTVFTFLTTSLSAAISRFLAANLAEGDSGRLRRIFSTGIIIQLGLALLLVLLVETLGQWWLNHRLVIPPGRLEAARWVLQCSLGVLVVTLLSVPYNAAIIAHERMSAFALISLGEAALKLGVALLLFFSPFDKLISYAVLILAVSVLVRAAYGFYCRRHFAETRGPLLWDGALVREMTAFAGWSFFGSSAYVFNTQGVNQVTNLFFGVAVNAARGVALQVENIVKQFVSNFLTAVNPQITKSWAAGDRDYCFGLVHKGAKYSWLVILAFFVPVLGEAEWLLGFWLGPDKVPPHAATFLRLTLVGLLVDVVGNPLVTLVQATGRVKHYYLVTGLTSYLGLPLVWLAFKLGADPAWAYVIFIAVYLVVLVQRIVFARRLADFPAKPFLRLLALLMMTSCFALVFPIVLRGTSLAPFWRLLLGTLLGWATIAHYAWYFLLTAGERDFFLRKVGKWLPDKWFLKAKYRIVFGRPLSVSGPVHFTEKIQWQKLRDRNPLYHTLADKAAVKPYVAERIGGEHVIPTLGVWDRPEQIDWEALPAQFVLKCTHDSGSTLICTDKAAFDRQEACAKLSAALSSDYWKRDREWAYKGVQPRIIAEKYLGAGLADYKIFCFGGKPEFLFVATDRDNPDEETKFDFFDTQWRHLDIRNGHPNAAVPPARPTHFDEMLRLATALAGDFPQVRIDFYETPDGRVLFGEYTFYHWSGFVPFDPDEADERLGAYFKIPFR
ncbi:MAG: oligosaccharide flippase family protein [Bacteroidales bacterium]|nr:oligosaccharide flippase family protein [Bacteroidales bacterium]